MAKFSLKKPLAVLIASGTALGSLSFGFTTAQAGTNVVTIGNPPMSSLDPTAWAGQILIDQGTVFEGLYGYNTKNQIVPKIATGYTLSKDGRTWTFTLRKDAKWSNGDPVTANDFYYSIMRLLDPSDSSGAIWASVASNLVNAWTYHAGGCPASAVGIKVINDYTLQMTTTVPHDILGELVLSGSMPLNKKSVEANPTSWWLPQNFVGDGPYVVKKFTPNGEVDLIKNKNYVGASGQTNVGNVDEIHIVPNVTVPVEDYMAKKLDVALIGSTSDLQYIKTHNLANQLHAQAANQVYYMEFDHAAAKSVLDNEKVRQAISMVINRAPIANNVLSGMVAPTTTFGGPGWLASKYETGLPYDVQKAQQLLKEAGYPGGKGIPTLPIYCEVQASDAKQVPIAEALSQEIHQALGINTKIIPLAATLYGGITWGGENKNIDPGFNIAVGVANWAEPGNDDMQGTDGVLFAGTYGYSPAFREHAYPWYTNVYNPDDVKAYGDPNNGKAGVTWSDWTKLQSDAFKDIQWLDSWYAQQPEPYRSQVTPLTPLMKQWQQLVSAWKSAKSDTDKHAAWVQAWKFVGAYSSGAGSANEGLNEQVYWDKNQSKQVHDWRMWQSEMANSTSDAAAAKLAGKITTQLMQQGWVTPLFYINQYFLARTNITDVQTNPWSWGNFYQLQYMNMK